MKQGSICFKKMVKTNIIIIMSTYNGERFIKQQLESLLNQTHPSDILIRDDGSNDDTLSIVKDYVERHVCIHLYKDNLGHIGLRESYFILLKESLKFSPDFICYADQDDIWFNDKTEKLLHTFTEKKPALVFSDVEVVDENLNLIYPSLSKLQQLDNHTEITLKKLLFYCPALGCTIMLNKPLAKLITSMPKLGKSLNHDKWALVLASIVGKIIYLPEPTLKYRQHSANTVGAMLGIKRKTWTFKNFHFLKMRYQTALDQAHDMSKIPFLPVKEKRLLMQFIKLFTENSFKRPLYYFKFIFTPPNWKRKCGLALSLFFKFSIQE